MYSASGWAIYVRPGPDSICAFAPHHTDGLLWPMTTLGFAKAGLTYFTINFDYPKQPPEQLNYLHIAVLCRYGFNHFRATVTFTCC